jgi:hypothetical protein
MIFWGAFQIAVVAIVVITFAFDDFSLRAISYRPQTGASVIFGVVIALLLTWSISMIIDFHRSVGWLWPLGAWSVFGALVYWAFASRTVHPVDWQFGHTAIYLGLPSTMLACTFIWIAEVLERLFQRLMGKPLRPAVIPIIVPGKWGARPWLSDILCVWRPLKVDPTLDSTPSAANSLGPTQPQVTSQTVQRLPQPTART